MNEKEMKKQERVANEFANNVISKLPNDKETADKVAMVLDIAKMFSEAKRKEV